MDKIRTIVSRNRRRYVRDDFDLDLAYILPNLIAMGFPARSVQKMYRNDFDELIRFIEKNVIKKESSFRIFNLCPGFERDIYGNEAIGSLVDNRFTTRDHHPPRFMSIVEFCETAAAAISGDKMTLLIHCKAGKGRTGVMVCCLLLYCRRFSCPLKAMEFYGQSRTYDGKAVTIPSQRRYIEYFSLWLDRLHLHQQPPHIKFYGVIYVEYRCESCRKVDRSYEIGLTLEDSKRNIIVPEVIAILSRKPAPEDCYVAKNEDAPSDDSNEAHHYHAHLAPPNVTELTEDVLFIATSYESKLIGKKSVTPPSIVHRNKQKLLHFWLNTSFLSDSVKIDPEDVDETSCLGEITDFEPSEHHITYKRLGNVTGLKIITLKKHQLDKYNKIPCQCHAQVSVVYKTEE